MRIDQGFPVFYGNDGAPLKSGRLYIGTVNLDPRLSPVAVFFDSAYTVAAPNPLTITNGVVMRKGKPASVFVAAEYSVILTDTDGVVQFSAPNGAAFPASDVVAQITPALTNTFLPKSGGVMTGPIVLADAVAAGQMYSRAQLDALLSSRSSATFVVDSILKWNQFVTEAAGNDYTRVLVKRGSYAVNTGVTVPSGCVELRGEYGAEIVFTVPDTTATYGLQTVAGQVTLISNLVFTVNATPPNNFTALSTVDAFVTDVDVAFVLAQPSAQSSGTLIGVAGSNVKNVTVTAYAAVTGALISVTAAFYIIGVNTVAPTTRIGCVTENIAVSAQSIPFAMLSRTGALNTDNPVVVVCVRHGNANALSAAWNRPKVSRFGLNTVSASTFTFVQFTGAATGQAATQLQFMGTLTLTAFAAAYSIMTFSNTTEHFVSIDYRASIAIIGGASCSFRQSFAPFTPVSDTAGSILSVKGHLVLNASLVVTQDVVYNARIVEIVLQLVGPTLAPPTLGANFAVRTCRRLRNCVVVLAAGTQYATDVYASSTTGAAVGNTAAGGWNN